MYETTKERGREIAKGRECMIEVIKERECMHMWMRQRRRKRATRKSEKERECGREHQIWRI